MADLKHSRNDYIFRFSFCGKKEKINLTFTSFFCLMFNSIRN